MLDNPVLRSRKLSPGAKVLWGLLCFYAREDESCYPGQDKLYTEVPCSPRGLRNFLSELQKAGLVEVIRRGLGRTNVYILHDIDNLFRPARGSDPERNDVPPGSARGADQEGHEVPVPVTKTQRKKTQGNKSRYPRTIGDRRVTATEGEMALSILEHWNAAACQSLSAQSFLEKILRRMREHPELSLDDHRRIIERILSGERWWSGTPDPRIIYGSDAQFESCMAQAQEAASVHSEVDQELDFDRHISGDSNARHDDDSPRADD